MTTTPASFEAVWALAESIPGWLTHAQAALLWDEASALPEHGLIVEIGSHQGRSTVVLASAAGMGGRLVAVDPFVDGRLFGGAATRQLFEDNIARAGLAREVELRSEYSTRLRPRWVDAIDLLYIDGKHDYWTVADDLRWSGFVRPGGAVLVHDSFSSIGVTLGLLRHVLPSRTLSYQGRRGSLALFRRRRPTPADRIRMLGELPWWVRNVIVKVLLRLRLRGLAKALGHDGPYDPF